MNHTAYTNVKIYMHNLLHGSFINPQPVVYFRYQKNASAISYNAVVNEVFRQAAVLPSLLAGITLFFHPFSVFCSLHAGCLELNNVADYRQNFPGCWRKSKFLEFYMYLFLKGLACFSLQGLFLNDCFRIIISYTRCLFVVASDYKTFCMLHFC